mgnify:FL=1
MEEVFTEVKTIISGPPDPVKKPKFSRKHIAVFVCAAIAACTIPVAAVVLPARGDVIASPDLMTDSMVNAPPAMLDDPGGYGESASSQTIEPDTPPAGSLDLRVQRSGQPLYDDGLFDSGDAEDATQNSMVADGEESDPNAAAQAVNDIESNMIPSGHRAPDDSSGSGQDIKDQAAAELAAARQELEEARLALAAERKAREEAEKAALLNAQNAAPSEPVATTQPDETQASDPPDWLVSDDAALDPDEPPDWLFTALDKAAWRNPYDGGPLCQLNYAQIPCPLDNADTRLYVELGAPLSTLTQGDLLEFVKKAIRDCDASWATIIGSDNMGLQFVHCNTDIAMCGPLDEYGQVTDALYAIVLTEFGYELVDVKG